MGFIISANYSKKNHQLVLKFEERVASTGGTIRILGKNNKELESLGIGSKKISGGIYSLNTYLTDYPYDWIALFNDEIFGALAKHDNKKIEDKTSEEWAFDLRTIWNVSIGGKFYLLNKSTTDELSSDRWYNYHSTTPEYTPGYDESGSKDIVLTPLGGVKSLKIQLNKKKIEPGDYKVDISDAGLRLAIGDDLNVNKDISDAKAFKVVGKTSSKNDKSNKNKKLKTTGSDFFTGLDNYLTAINGRKGFADFAADDELTGTYKITSNKIIRIARFSFSGLGTILNYFSDGFTHVTQKKKDNTPFGNAVEKGDKFYYYNGKNKVASITFLGSNLDKQINQFKNKNHSGTFNLSLEDNRIDFYKGSKEPWMSATFVNDLF